MKLYFLDISGSDMSPSSAGEALVRCVLSRETGRYISPSDIYRTAYGKPRLADESLCFNLSHSGGYVMLGVGVNELGVDIQRHRGVSRALVRRVCSERELSYLDASPDFERDFFRLWCLKESYIKADGRGLCLGLGNIAFDISSFDFDSSISSDFPGATFRLYEEIDGYTAAVCEICEPTQDIV